MNLRWEKRLIALSYHTIIFAITIIGINTQADFLVAVGIFDLITFRLIPITRFIQRQLILTGDCPSCQKQIDLKDTWKCGCGYASQTPRHIFLPCQQCGKQN